MKKVKKVQKFDDLTNMVSEALANINDFPDDNEPIVSVGEHDIVKMTYDNIKLYILNAYTTRHSLLLYGDPGLGKSAIVLQTAKQIASSMGRQFVAFTDFNDWENDISSEIRNKLIEDPSKYFVFIDVRTAQLEPSDLVGIPNISSREKYLESLPQKWVYFMSLKGSAGILFLDELNQGSPQIMKALYQVVYDRAVGNLSFTKDWGIMAAGNLGGLFQNDTIPVALTNRFLAGILIADPDAWLRFAYEADINENIIAFIESNKQDNFYRPPAEQTSNPFPSPRQFVALSKQMTNIVNQYAAAKENHTPMVQSIYKTIGDTAAQLCGVNWAQRFIAFVRYQKIYDWATIAADPEKHINSKTDPDKNHALVMVARDALIKAFAENSTADAKAKAKFAVEFSKVVIAFAKEWRMVLMTRINTKAKDASANYLVYIYQNAKQEPFKSAIAAFEEASRLNKGES